MNRHRIRTGCTWQDRLWKTVAPVATLMAAISLAGLVVAQPPGRPEGAGPGRSGPGGAGRGGPGGPPSPERFVEHAMSFDADGDGKLDRAELTKFAEDIQRMRGGRGGPGGPGGGPGGPGRGGPGVGGGGAPGEPGGSGGGSGERPQRPRRPE